MSTFDRTALAKALREKTAISEELALRTVNDFFDKFIEAKKLEQDWDGTRLSPSPLIDAVWHAVLLDTRRYQALCGKKFIHHNPDGAAASDAAERAQRYNRTRSVLRESLHTELDKEIWPDAADAQPEAAAEVVPVPVSNGRKRKVSAKAAATPPKKESKKDKFQVLVKTLTGMILSFRVDRETTVLQLKTLFQEKGGVPVVQQRMIFAGRELEDERTMADYNIGIGATLHLVLRLGGC